MKRILTSLTIAVIALLPAIGQESNGEISSLCSKLSIDWQIGTMTKSHGIAPRPLQLSIGYKVLPKLSCYLSTEAVLALRETEVCTP